MKQATFRVDSSIKIGAGHLMRCLTLADDLKKSGYEVTFVSRDLLGNLISLINHKVITLPRNDNFESDDLYLDWLGATQKQDARQTIRVISSNLDLLIVDSYAIDEVWHRELRLHAKKIMVIDDLVNKKFDCDILLNQNLGSQLEDYQNNVPSDCDLLLGCNYALLRAEFAELRGEALKKRENTKEIKRILVSVGGSDPDNIIYDILQQIDNSYHVVVAIRKESPHNEVIKDYAKDKNVEIIIDANNMAELMLNADLAIGASGSSAWERCCMGLPTLLYVLEDNQREIAESLTHVGAVKIIKDLSKDLSTISGEFMIWHDMSTKAQKVCDGLGSKKVSQFLRP